MRIKEATKDARVTTAHGLGRILGVNDDKLINIRLDTPISIEGKKTKRVQVRPRDAQLVLTGINFEACELAVGRSFKKLVETGRKQGIAFAAARLLLGKSKAVPKRKLMEDVAENFPMMLPALKDPKVDAAKVLGRIELTQWLFKLEMRDVLRKRLSADGVSVTAKAEYLRCRVPDRAGKLRTLYVDDVADILIDKNKLVACALHYRSSPKEDAEDITHVYMHRAPEGHMVLNIN